MLSLRTFVEHVTRNLPFLVATTAATTIDLGKDEHFSIRFFYLFSRCFDGHVTSTLRQGKCCRAVRRDNKLIDGKRYVELNIAKNVAVRFRKSLRARGGRQGGGHENTVACITGRGQVGITCIEGSFVGLQQLANAGRILIFSSVIDGRGHVDEERVSSKCKVVNGVISNVGVTTGDPVAKALSLFFVGAWCV